MAVPVLFLHGWAMNGAIFQDLANRLGAEFECHAPDLPGHGENLESEPSLDNCARFTRDWITDLDRPILVGWSMGAAVAWRYISQFGTSQIRGLVTIDMSPRMLPDRDWDMGLNGQSTQTITATSDKITSDWQGRVNGVLRNMFARDTSKEVALAPIEQLLRGQHPAKLRLLWDDLIAMDERKTIPRIDVPYLVCCGTQSRLYKADVADWIAKRASNARVSRFSLSGHSPHLEQPTAFSDAISQFIRADCLEKAKQEAPRPQ